MNCAKPLAYFVSTANPATLLSLFFSVRHFVILVKRREARVNSRIIQNTWSILIGWLNFNDIWKVRVLEFQIIIFLNYQSLFLCPKSWVKISSKIENLYKTSIEYCWSLITKKEEVALEESRHFQGELLKPHRLKEERPLFSVL